MELIVGKTVISDATLCFFIVLVQIILYHVFQKEQGRKNQRGDGTDCRENCDK